MLPSWTRVYSSKGVPKAADMMGHSASGVVVASVAQSTAGGVSWVGARTANFWRIAPLTSVDWWHLCQFAGSRSR